MDDQRLWAVSGQDWELLPWLDAKDAAHDRMDRTGEVSVTLYEYRPREPKDIDIRKLVPKAIEALVDIITADQDLVPEDLIPDDDGHYGLSIDRSKLEGPVGALLRRLVYRATCFKNAAWTETGRTSEVLTEAERDRRIRAEAEAHCRKAEEELPWYYG